MRQRLQQVKAPCQPAKSDHRQCCCCQPLSRCCWTRARRWIQRAWLPLQRHSAVLLFTWSLALLWAACPLSTGCSGEQACTSLGLFMPRHQSCSAFACPYWRHQHSSQTPQLYILRTSTTVRSCSTACTMLPNTAAVGSNKMLSAAGTT